MMNADGTTRKQVSNTGKDIAGFLFSPDEKQVILVMEVNRNHSIAKNNTNLPEATGMVINDLMYKHWDTYVTTAPPPLCGFIRRQRCGETKDLLEGEPYESPMMPFGGMEQLAWSPDSKSIAYTCRKKVGKSYAISRQRHLPLRSEHRNHQEPLKPADYVAPEIEADRSLQHQAVNKPATDCNMVTTKTHSSRPTDATWHGAAWNATATKATVRAFVCSTSKPAKKRMLLKSLKVASTNFVGHRTARTCTLPVCGTAKLRCTPRT